MIFSKQGEQIKPKPKKTRQGKSANSKPRHNNKISRGQGR